MWEGKKRRKIRTWTGKKKLYIIHIQDMVSMQMENFSYHEVINIHSKVLFQCCNIKCLNIVPRVYPFSSPERVIECFCEKEKCLNWDNKYFGQCWMEETQTESKHCSIEVKIKKGLLFKRTPSVKNMKSSVSLLIYFKTLLICCCCIYRWPLNWSINSFKAIKFLMGFHEKKLSLSLMVHSPLGSVGRSVKKDHSVGKN